MYFLPGKGKQHTFYAASLLTGVICMKFKELWLPVHGGGGESHLGTNKALSRPLRWSALGEGGTPDLLPAGREMQVTLAED